MRLVNLSFDSDSFLRFIFSCWKCTGKADFVLNRLKVVFWNHHCKCSCFCSFIIASFFWSSAFFLLRYFSLSVLMPYRLTAQHFLIYQTKFLLDSGAGIHIEGRVPAISYQPEDYDSNLVPPGSVLPTDATSFHHLVLVQDRWKNWYEILWVRDVTNPPKNLKRNSSIIITEPWLRIQNLLQLLFPS